MRPSPNVVERCSSLMRSWSQNLGEAPPRELIALIDDQVRGRLALRCDDQVDSELHAEIVDLLTSGSAHRDQISILVWDSIERLTQYHSGEGTRLLQKWQSGSAVTSQVFGRFGGRLESQAAYELRQYPVVSLEPQEVVNEIYPALKNYRRRRFWVCQPEFFALTRLLMRRKIFDLKKGLTAQKRPESVGKESLEVALETLGVQPDAKVDLIVLRQAVQKLGEFDEREKRVIELILDGLTEDEAAKELRIPLSTVKALKGRAVKHLRILMGLS